jgi:HAD superfamily phosphatase (TIGR01668 family)
MLKPNLFINKVTDLTLDYLNKNNIKVVLLDIDNTILAPNHKLLDGLLPWVDNMKENGIKIYCLSNTYSRRKQKKIEDMLKIKVIINANKPFQKGFRKAIKIFDINKEETAMVGDQIFTDVLGGNWFGIHTIYVNPISLKGEDLIIGIRRPLERIFLNRYRE